MAFVLPTFNITVDIFGAILPPPIGPPRLSLMAQLRAPAANNAISVPGAGLTSSMVLLLPPLTDIRDANNSGSTSSDIVEAPAGTGRYYRVFYVDDIAKGFPNEHRYAVLIKMAGVPWPVPFP